MVIRGKGSRLVRSGPTLEKADGRDSGPGGCLFSRVNIGARGGPCRLPGDANCLEGNWNVDRYVATRGETGRSDARASMGKSRFDCF